MTDFTKLKKLSKLGMPPAMEEIKNNLAQPEIFEDGRSKRKTGRTHQLATRVTVDFYRRVRMIASRDNLKIVELLEKAIDAYEDKDSS